MPLPSRQVVKKSKMRATSSRATTRDSCSRDEAKPPASVQATHEAKKMEKKMQPAHASTSSHRRPTGRFLGAGFDRRLLALRKAFFMRRLRPAGRLTCRAASRRTLLSFPDAKNQKVIKRIWGFSRCEGPARASLPPTWFLSWCLVGKECTCVLHMDSNVTSAVGMSSDCHEMEHVTKDVMQNPKRFAHA